MVIVWVSIFQALKAQVVWWLGCSKPKPKPIPQLSSEHYTIRLGFRGEA